MEGIPNEDRVSPPLLASFSLVLLANTSGGEARTAKELEKMFSNAGFSSIELHALPPTPQKAVVSQK